MGKDLPFVARVYSSGRCWARRKWMPSWSRKPEDRAPSPAARAPVHAVVICDSDAPTVYAWARSVSSLWVRSSTVLCTPPKTWESYPCSAWHPERSRNICKRKSETIISCFSCCNIYVDLMKIVYFQCNLHIFLISLCNLLNKWEEFLAQDTSINKICPILNVLAISFTSIVNAGRLTTWLWCLDIGCIKNSDERFVSAHVFNFLGSSERNIKRWWRS